MKTQAAPRLIPRPHMILAPGAPVICPRSSGHRGHIVRHNAAILSQEALICQYRAAAGAAECGARIYVLQLGHGWRYVIEISTKEMLYLRDHQLATADALAYFAVPAGVHESDAEARPC